MSHWYMAERAQMLKHEGNGYGPSAGGPIFSNCEIRREKIAIERARMMTNLMRLGESYKHDLGA